MSSTSPSPISPVATAPPPLPSSPPNPPNSPPPETPTAPPPRPNSPPPEPPSAPPPQPNSPPPDPLSAPPPQLNSTPPQSPPPTSEAQSPPSSSTPPMASPPPTSPPPANVSPPPSQPSSPPPTLPPPQPAPPPPSLSPPSQPSSPPPTVPPPQTARSPPPPSLSPPSQPSSPPPTTPPPAPPRNSPPPPPSDPPSSPPSSTNVPPPPPEPSNNSPPPPTPRPSQSPPPPATPPTNSPPPPTSNPPASSPPPPSITPPPPNSTAPSVPTPTPPAAPPSPNSPPITSPPPLTLMSPPPPSVVSPPPPFSPPPSLFTPGTNNTNNTSGSSPEISPSARGGGIGTGGTVAIALVLGILFLGVLGTAACCVWKRRKKDSGHNGGHIMPTSVGSSPKSDSGLLKVQISAPINGSSSRNGLVYSPHEPGGMGNSRSWFAYEELVEATNGFSAQNLLGEGGFGCVYKGSLADGRTVAVKQLKIGGGQGEREFRSEVEIIGRIHHRHLVSLVGYCISMDRRLLVYEYVPNDTLYFHLHGEGRPVMDWAGRVKIATGAARGIAYLHEDCHPRIIHRDIKSSNILLDDNFEARVSDFGLAKLAMDMNTHITTRVMGTFGYMAPEYASSGKLTEKSDVYSFGVVLLELVTGRKPVDTSQPLGEESLVEWARPLLSHALETEEFGALADPSLEGRYVDNEMFRMIEAAAACVRHSSAKRPKMGQVVRALDSMATSDLTNGMRVGESEIFNSAQQSAEIRLFQRMAFGSQDYSTDFFSQHSSSEGNQVNSRREYPKSISN